MEEVPRARRLPTALAVLTVAVAAGAVVVAAVLDAGVDPAHRARIVTEPGWVSALSGVALAVPGAILLHREPRHPVAWVLCLTGVHWSVDSAAASWLVHATRFDPPLAGASLAFWVFQRLGAALLLALPLVLLLYPDGRLPTGRWRVAALVSLAATALLPAALLFAPSTAAESAASGGAVPDVYRGLDLDPITIPLPDGLWTGVLRVAYALVPLSLIVPFAVVVRRFRAARTRDDRARMRWLLWAAVVDLMVMATSLLLPDSWASAGLLVAVTATGFAVTVGIVRPHLFDIDRLLGGTVLYGLLALAVVLVDLAVVGATRALLDERDAALLALLVVLAVYGPLRHRLWLLVRRLVLGRRDDPYGVLAGLAERLERSGTVEDQLLATAGAVAQAFRLPYVGVEVDRPGGGTVLAEHGERPVTTRSLPVSYRGEEVGRLVLPTRRPRTGLSARDERLLADVVRQAAAAAHTSFLAQQLQESRQHIVAAREEERRRLRRDLHDGLGPSLGAVGLRIETARNLARAGKDADDVLRRAREDVGGALADVRRLVHDLRPPALDDVGLLGAVRQQAERLRAPGLSVRVDGGDGLDGLPAALEVAAYRIASEALTNVVRHAAAAHARVSLGVDGGQLVVEVEDDGVGIASRTAAGVGLVSLRERAAELGGRCRIWCPNGRGTVVRAELPLRGGPVE